MVNPEGPHRWWTQSLLAQTSDVQKYEGENEGENDECWVEVAEPGQGDCVAKGGQNCRQRGQMARAACVRTCMVSCFSRV